MEIRNFGGKEYKENGWPVIALDYIGIFLNPVDPSIICSNGRCYVPRAESVDEHLLLIKRN